MSERAPHSPDTQWIGAKLRALLEASPLSRRGFLLLLKIRERELGKYERGVSRIPFDLMIEIADLLGVELEDFRPPPRINPFEPPASPPTLGDARLLEALRAWPRI